MWTCIIVAHVHAWWHHARPGRAARAAAAEMVSAKASDAQQWQAVQRGVVEELRGELAQGGGEGSARMEARLQVRWCAW